MHVGYKKEKNINQRRYEKNEKKKEKRVLVTKLIFF